MISKHSRGIAIKLMVVGCVILLSACSKQSVQRAGEGATMGAVVGAAGGMVSALVFGGDVGNAAARGAVWGASTGAVSGAVVGAQETQIKKDQQAAAIEKLKSALGEDAFNGLAALTKCKHETALGYARTAAQLDDKNHALAGLWIEVLAYADSQKEDQARALFSDLVSQDPKISSEAQAEESMRKALQKLMDIRGEFNLPRICG
jgi:hypothetical protein